MPTYASSALGARDQTATAPVMTAADGISRRHAQSASITWPIIILYVPGLMQEWPTKVEVEVKYTGGDERRKRR
jgi:hypothetical protein